MSVYPGGAVPSTSTANPTPARNPAAAAVVTGVVVATFAVRSKASVDLVVDAWAWLTA